VFVDERDVLNAAFDEMESSRRTQPTGPDYDYIGVTSHRVSLSGQGWETTGDPRMARIRRLRAVRFERG